MTVGFPEGGQQNLTDRQRARLDAAFTARAEHVEVEVAYRCAQQVRSAYHQTSHAAGRAVAEKVLAALPSCPIPEVARLGKTLHQWRQAFFGYFETDVADNGGPEAVNGLIEGGPGRLPLRSRFFPNADHQPRSEPVFQAVRSGITWSASRAFVQEEPVAELGVIEVSVEPTRWRGRQSSEYALRRSHCGHQLRWPIRHASSDVERRSQGRAGGLP